jgi:hypothetical protein
MGIQSARYHADGSTALTTPSNSVYIGFQARGFNNSDNNSIVIGASAVGLGANTTVIGNSSTIQARVFGALTANSFIPTSSTVPTNGVYLPATNAVAIATNSTRAVYIDSSQNVGIGVSSPVSKLQLASKAVGNTDANLTLDGTATPKFRVTDNSGSAIGRRYVTNNFSRPAGVFTADDAAYGVTQVEFNDGYLTFGTAAAGTANPTERMRIDATGKVGIGTTTPTELLHVRGSSPRLFIDSSGGVGAGNPVLQFGLAGNFMYWFFDGTNGYLRTDNASRHILLQAGGTQGNVGIGTETPQGKLDVNGTIRSAGYTVATLPAGVVGMTAYVTDAVLPTFLGTLTGGGSVHTPVFRNATGWVSG